MTTIAQSPARPFTRQISPRLLGRRLVSGLFWSWNLLFLAFVGLGVAPLVLLPLLLVLRDDVVPLSFVTTAGLLVTIPLLSTGLGLTVLRRHPARQFALFYGVEGPLMVICLARLFVLRELTPSTTLVVVLGGLAIATFAWRVLAPGDATVPGNAVTDLLRTLSMALVLAVGLYIGAVLAFYAPPLAALLGQFLRTVMGGLLSLLLNGPRDILSALSVVPFLVLGVLVLLYSATLAIALPVLVPLLYGRAWWRQTRAVADRRGWVAPSVMTAATLVLAAAVCGALNRQPQQTVFALLAGAPRTQAERLERLARSDEIRGGLVNAYLAPYRYVSGRGQNDHIAVAYQRMVGVSPGIADRVQAGYNLLLSPFLYDGDYVHYDQQKAAGLYASFFDEPIQQGERRAIRGAISSTWQTERAQAGLLDVDEQRVLLLAQDLTVQERGDWADVELHEVYRNQTTDPQEVVYFFSLPETAAVTGLWLGESADRRQRFPFRVAPRGAAQTVYRQQVVVERKDPALIEQIGPRQYRLRAFPVLPRPQQSFDDGRLPVVEAPSLHLWLTYRVLAATDTWPLPALAEKRNVFWDQRTLRTLDGLPAQSHGDGWLPAALPLSAAAPRRAHRFDFGDQSVVAQPAQATLGVDDRTLRLAVVVDRSHSMSQRADEVSAALFTLAGSSAAGGSDLFLTAAPGRGEEPIRVPLSAFDPASLVFYGGQDAATLLRQFDELGEGRAYDAVLVLTDDGGYSLADDGAVPVPAAPTWLVHLADDFPPGYDDGTLDALLASGGGVAGSVEEALGRLGTPDRSGDVTTATLDGYIWSVGDPAAFAGDRVEPSMSTAPTMDGFGALAARQLIAAQAVGREPDPTTLDRLHSVARQQAVVTPYSSMIVLVNEGQQRALDEAEQAGDRFTRETERGEQALTAPPNPFDVTGVPEPEEWLLLALAAAALVWLTRSEHGRMVWWGRRGG